MKINVLLQSVNIVMDPQNPGNLLLTLEVGGNPKLSEDVKILAFSCSPVFIGHMCQKLFEVLQLPSIQHISGTPAVLEYNNNLWSISNFLDDSKYFKGDEVVKQLSNVASANSPEPSFE